MPYDLGDVVPLTVQVRDANGALANAGTIAVTITLPDATAATPTVTNPPATTGVYVLDYTPTQSGRHLVRWVASGSNASAHTDSFDVRASAPPLFFSLTDARSILNLSTTTQDSLIRDLIESTTASVEFLIGPVVRQTVTERHEGGWYTLALRQPPVISVQTMTPILTAGTSYTSAEVDIDAATGIVQLLDGGRFAGPLRVAYTAGMTVTPAAVRDAARIILKHLWRIRNGVDGLPGIGAPADYGESFVAGLGYALPDAALQLLQPYARGPMV
jgi:phage tail protein X